MADYTKGMSALHHILTQTPMNTTLSKKGQLPPFTASHLKAGLRTSWTAEQIGRLAIKYESEWDADSGLSKSMIGQHRMPTLLNFLDQQTKLFKEE